MAAILLLDLSNRFARTLVPVLEVRKHKVQTVTTVEEVFRSLRRAKTRFDVVMIDLSENRDSDWKILESIRTTIITAELSIPMILCLTERNWGAEMRLNVEKMRGRLVVIRE